MKERAPGRGGVRNGSVSFSTISVKGKIYKLEPDAFALGFEEEDFLDLALLLTLELFSLGESQSSLIPQTNPVTFPHGAPPPPQDYTGVATKTSLPGVTHVILETQGAQSVPQGLWAGLWTQRQYAWSEVICCHLSPGYLRPHGLRRWGRQCLV